MSEKLTTLPMGTTFCDTSKLPMNIVCNGFDMKETILEVLSDHKRRRYYLDDADIDQIAEEIKEAFAVKLGLKQG